MKILVVTTSYPRFPGDAAGGFVETRVAAHLGAGHEVTVIAAGSEQANEPRQPTSHPRLRIVWLPAPPKGVPPLFYAGGAPESFEARPAASVVAALHLWSFLVESVRRYQSEVDFCESHWLVPSGLALAASRNGDRPAHRAFAHSGDVALLERVPGGASLARFLVGSRVELVFASADLRGRFARLVGGSLGESVLRARVEPAESLLTRVPARRPPLDERARQIHALGLPRPLILAVGRLVPIKGYDRLVRAVARADAAVAPRKSTLVILGEGQMRERLAELSVRGRVKVLLPGEVRGVDVARWLSLADIFVHPARRLATGRTEGTPVAVREALAAGLPVIATDTGGIGELRAEFVTRRLVTLDAEPEATFVDRLARALLVEGNAALAAVSESRQPPEST